MTIPINKKKRRGGGGVGRKKGVQERGGTARTKNVILSSGSRPENWYATRQIDVLYLKRFYDWAYFVSTVP